MYETDFRNNSSDARDIFLNKNMSEEAWTPGVL